MDGKRTHVAMFGATSTLVATRVAPRRRPRLNAASKYLRVSDGWMAPRTRSPAAPGVRVADRATAPPPRASIHTARSVPPNTARARVKENEKPEPIAGAVA